MISHSDRRESVTLIEQACAQGARLEPACAVVGISSRTYQRWTEAEEIAEDQRPHAVHPRPEHALTDEEEAEILAQCHRPEFASLPPEQIVVRLMDEEGRYIASVSSFYRVLRKHDELTHRGRAKARQAKRSATTHHAEAPNQVWAWDCTWLPAAVKGLYYYLVMIIDIYSRKIVGWEVFARESAENSKSVIERAVLAEHVVLKPLVLHSDNGSPFKGATLLEKLRELNITSSFSRPRVSNDNAYAEALFRTCKYVPDYPAEGFASITAARQWVMQFVDWYNTEHRHSGIRFVTPQQRHEGRDAEILDKRHTINEATRREHSRRWSGKTRDWTPVGTVTLNPEREEVKRPSQ